MARDLLANIPIKRQPRDLLAGITSTTKPTIENAMLQKSEKGDFSVPLYEQLDIKEHPVLGTAQDIAGQAGTAFINQFGYNLPKQILKGQNINLPEPVTPLGKAAEIVGGGVGIIGSPITRGIGLGAKLLSKAPKMLTKTVLRPSVVGSATASALYTPETEKGTLKEITAPIERGKQALLGAGLVVGGIGAKKALVKPIKDVIDYSISKAIRPSVKALKKSSQEFQNYYNKARDAVISIIDNKNNLKYATPEGEEVVGKLPRSLTQFADSIKQTKETIFKQYNELAKSAGQKGAEIDLKPIANKVLESASTKELQTLYPELADYAMKRAVALETAGKLSAEETQNAIKLLNKSLEAFYRNPSYESATKASIDAQMVNNLRKALDEQITNLTGKEYQAIKNKYSSLLSLEKDVNHRAVVDARKNIKGFFDLTDILSAGDVIRGLATLNPADIAKGATQFGVKSWFKWLNNPNRIVSDMFKIAEKGGSLPTRIYEKGAKIGSGILSGKYANKDFIKKPSGELKKPNIATTKEVIKKDINETIAPKLGESQLKDLRLEIDKSVKQKATQARLERMGELPTRTIESIVKEGGGKFVTTSKGRVIFETPGGNTLAIPLKLLNSSRIKDLINKYRK
jgi:hypothetical protein